MTVSGALVPSTPGRKSPARTQGYLGNDIALIDLLDRLLHGGIVIQGDITLAVADIDLVNVELRLLIASIDKLMGA
jgi:Gas vesicle protein